MLITQIKNRNFSIFINAQQLNNRITELASTISKDIADKDPLFIAVLNGSFMFAADLFKEFNFPCQISFVKIASYQGSKSTGNITELVGLKENIEGRHIILIEDIIDTGLTIQHLLEEVIAKKPASLRIATLLLKREALKIEINPEYVGFEVPNKFLIGYGLDYDGYGRNLKHIYAEVE
jgi:hypoxanthine phosphoribosyltransferase